MQAVERLHLKCLFSEDSRPEASGQTTLVGWYPSGRVEIPAEGGVVLLKLCITAIIEMPPKCFPKHVVFDVRLDEEVLQHIELPQAAINDMRRQDQEDEANSGRRGWQMTIAMQFGNFAVKHNGMLRVFARVDDEELIGNGLRFFRKKEEIASKKQRS